MLSVVVARVENGVCITTKTTTIQRPDGTVETKVEESRQDTGNGGRLSSQQQQQAMVGFDDFFM